MLHVQVDAILAEELIDPSLCPICPRAGLETMAWDNSDVSDHQRPPSFSQRCTKHVQTEMHEGSLEGFQAYSKLYESSCLPLFNHLLHLKDRSVDLKKVGMPFFYVAQWLCPLQIRLMYTPTVMAQ